MLTYIGSCEISTIKGITRGQDNITLAWLNKNRTAIASFFFFFFLWGEKGWSNSERS